MYRGYFLTLYVIRCQVAAMPNPKEVYLVRSIHHATGVVAPAERLWTAGELSMGGGLRYLRRCNSQGFDIYFQAYGGDQNSGYILLDLDGAEWAVIETMRANGHQPCVVLETSLDHLQAWVRISPTPLQPAVATAVARHLARLYHADRASADWRRLGRLAGFTNQKPERRLPGGYAPFVKILHAEPGLASAGPELIQAAQRQCWQCSPADRHTQSISFASSARIRPVNIADDGNDSSAAKPAALGGLTAAVAGKIYSRWLHRLRIPQRFPQPDWSIADLWIAKELLRCRVPLQQIQAVLRLGSPGFPRRHSDPDDYLCRTLARAARDLERTPFSARPSTTGRDHPPAAVQSPGAG